MTAMTASRDRAGDEASQQQTVSYTGDNALQLHAIVVETLADERARHPQTSCNACNIAAGPWRRAPEAVHRKGYHQA